MKAVYENHYLSDTDVANFARQSFAKLAENFTPEQNNNLIRFLARGMASGDWQEMTRRLVGGFNGPDERKMAHDLAVYLRNIPEHWVPFGHPQISLRMQAPIPIRVQSFKHKIGFVESEESRRYIKTTPEYFTPEWRLAAVNVKQGSSGKHPAQTQLDYGYQKLCDAAVELYGHMVNDWDVCPEQARFVLPQGCEVNWVWTGSLYAYANFYNQRTNSHAQKEIQDLAHMVGEIIEPLYPVSWAALTRGEY